MGYNPYVCVICGEIEDNGWYDYDWKHYKDMVNKSIEEIHKMYNSSWELEEFLDFHKKMDNANHMTPSLCERCYNKHFNPKTNKELDEFYISSLFDNKKDDVSDDASDDENVDEEEKENL